MLKLVPLFEIIVLIFTMHAVLVCSDDCTNEGSDDALVLKPVELIDLILEEQFRGNAPSEKNQHKRTLVDHGGGVSDLAKATTLVASASAIGRPGFWACMEGPPLVLTFTTKEQYNDIESLRSRKIWSRWGKWGDCSVTCGNGVIVRRRLCVSGRCAPHELEEQRRPCTRAPCYGDTPLIDDLHDLE